MAQEREEEGAQEDQVGHLESQKEQQQAQLQNGVAWDYQEEGQHAAAQEAWQVEQVDHQEEDVPKDYSYHNGLVGASNNKRSTGCNE